MPLLSHASFTKIIVRYTAFLLIFFIYLQGLRAQTAIDLSRPVGITEGTAGSNGMGAATYTIPVEIPAGIKGLQPSITVNYSSQGIGNGFGGHGWSAASISMISRTGKNNFHNDATTPVNYTGINDAFVLDGQRLMVISGTNGTNGAVYGTEQESFSKIESFGGDGNSPAWFRVTTKNGTVMEYGTDNAKLLTNDNTQVIFWALRKVTDANGNYMLYNYSIDNTNRYYFLSSINYTGNANTGTQPAYTVSFSYTTKTDWQNAPIYMAGSTLYLANIINKIDVKKSNGDQIRSYSFSYQYRQKKYFLTSVTETGADGTTLNPVTFTYGENVGATDVAISNEFSGFQSLTTPGLYSADFDGNGVQDIQEYELIYDNYDVGQYRRYFPSGGGSYSFPKIVTRNNITDTVKADGDITQKPFIHGDFDGDGKDDVLYVLSYNSRIPSNYQKFKEIRINYSRKLDTSAYITIKNIAYSSIPTSAYGQHNYIKTIGSYFTSGDFDGDGNMDYILILSNSSYDANKYKAFISTPAKNIFNQEIANFGVGVNGAIGDFAATNVAESKELIPINFDGDGKTDLLVVRDEASYILSISGNATTGFISSIVSSTTDIKTDYKIYPGDFNGDGNADILVRQSASDPLAAWKILYSTGKTFNITPFTFACKIYLPGDGFSNGHLLSVADYDKDGKTDIWHSLDTSGTSLHYVYYSNGTSFETESFYGNGKVNTESSSLTGDFNGDGKSDMLSMRYNNGYKAKYIYAKPFKEQNLLTEVSNLGYLTRFDYALLNGTDGYGSDLDSVYSRSALYEFDNPNEGPDPVFRPYAILRSPMYVLADIKRPSGLTASYTLEAYRYQDLVIHPSGRGMLGFKKTEFREPTGIYNISNNDINLQYSILYAITSTSIHALDNNSTISQSTIDISFQSLSTSSVDKRFFSKADRILKKDFLTNAATETLNTYDNYGNITQSIVKAGTWNGVSLTAIETATANTTYASYAGATYPGFPLTYIAQKTRNGQPQVGKKTTYTYTATGLPETVAEAFLDNGGTALSADPVINNRQSGITTYLATNSITFGPGFETEQGAIFTARITTANEAAGTITTTNVYNGFGLPTQTSIDAPGVTTPVTNYMYDATGQFLLEKKLTGYGITKKETYTYDDRWGVPLTQTTTDGLTTSFVYNSFGELTRTNYPDGNAATITKNWDTTGNVQYVVTMQRLDGSNPTKSYIDILGREIKKEVRGFSNQWLTSTKTFNYLGQLTYETAPYYAGEPVSYTAYTYDKYGRKIKQQQSTKGVTTYTYNNADSVNFIVTTKNRASQSVSQTTDASGKTIQTTTNGVPMSFTYDSWGNQLQSASNGQVFISNVYDNHGRKIATTDTNAGTVTYQYNSIGQVIQQTDANSNVQNMSYDVFGRTATSSGTQGVTTYTYYYDPGTGKSNNNITQIVGFSGDVHQYQYDNLQRAINETVTAAGSSLSKSFEYDIRGNLVKTNYPAGFAIRDEYDDNGILTQTKYEQGATVKTLFTATAINSRGIYTGYNTGNGKTKQVTYDFTKEAATRYYTAGVQDLNLLYEANTMNLLSRSDAIKNLTENFTYDKDDRLTSAMVNGVQQFAITYDAAAQGKILQKTDVGNYQYNTQKLHALEYLTSISGGVDPATIIGTNTQAITYTSFLKTATVGENGYTQTYSYGYDRQRITSELKYNGATIETKSYWGVMEGITKNGVSSEIYYIQAGNGLNNIIVKQNGAINIYYTYTDQLGSITAVTNEAGTIIAEQNFDAWGRKRNPTDWTYSNIPAAPDWLYRGFTGHEHLTELGLINMNGRMYDPHTGQMLAPDNYVQYPGSPGGYNRYQYANGNPLKYTDPSGDLSIGAWNSFWTFVGNGGGMNGGYISGSMGSVIEFGSSDQAFGYGITQVGNYDWWGAYSGYATSYKQALNRYNGGQTTPDIVTGYYRYEWRNTGRYNINANYAGGVHKDQGYSVGWAGGYGTADPTVGSMFVSYNKMESLLSATGSNPWKIAGGVAGALLADDVTGIGGVDDLVIPLAFAGAAAYDLAQRMYITYTLTGPQGQKYAGRASGFGNPYSIMMTRYASHHMKANGYSNPVIDVFAQGLPLGYSAIRGREQQLIDFYGGVGDPNVGNSIRGVGYYNLEGRYFHNMSNLYFGPLAGYTGFF